MGVSCLAQILTWVDALFAVHSDTRSHTGDIMSFGLDFIHQKSSVQKNSIISCKAEVIGVPEYPL